MCHLHGKTKTFLHQDVSGKWYAHSWNNGYSRLYETLNSLKEALRKREIVWISFDEFWMRRMTI